MPPHPTDEMLFNLESVVVPLSDWRYVMSALRDDVRWTYSGEECSLLRSTGP